MALPRFELIHHTNGVNGVHLAPVRRQQAQEERAVSTVPAHVVVAVRAEDHERDAMAAALRVAAGRRARVTLLHVMAPLDRPSFHWLDGIEKLHHALSRSRRNSAAAVNERRAAMEAFLNREIPRELRDGVDIRCECRVGEVAREIARFADEHTADMVILCNCPSTWRLSLWPGVSRRVASLLPKPVVLAHARA